jgi:hypothetical protein
LARHQFAVLALAALALCSIFWSLLNVEGAVSHRQVVRIVYFETRLEQLRRTLDPSSPVGWISDNGANDSAAALLEYHLTQYTLAPVKVKNTDKETDVVGIFDAGKIDQALLASHKLYLVRDFNNGVAMCRRLGR